MNKTKKLSIIVLACIFLSLAISSTASAIEYDEYGNPIITSEDWGIYGLGVAACAIFAVVWFIIFIAIAIWVYKDAEKRGSSGALWLIIVILLGILGIIIWLIIRPPIGGRPQQQQQAAGRMCTNCGRPIPMDAQVCPYCGKNFQQK